MSEALSGALPMDQNSPQQCPFGLYAEQLSGSAFTRARHQNLRSWLYRTLPSVVHRPYVPYPHEINQAFAPVQAPNPMRWSPLIPVKKKTDFIDGLRLMAGSERLNAYRYQCNTSMENRYMSNHDGEMLFVPYAGTMALTTEFGRLDVAPGQIALIPRGVHFRVDLLTDFVAGYLCENGGVPLALPELGTLGANGLANPRHFLYPKAAFETTQQVQLICKSQQHWWVADSSHSPLNVVAWHGNYAPYSYDLSLFNAFNTTSFDHPDPSIFTVLTSESDTRGVGHLDFVVFPPRWMVAEHTFRPPYFHRNVMSELMGLLKGTYDAKQDGFLIGGISIHNGMIPHGPDAQTYQKEINRTLTPEYYDNTLAFMFEARAPWQIAEDAIHDPSFQHAYAECWQSLQPATQNL